ncbi:TetR/AcrR family transcriptional regulator [Amycolatopsis sp. NPDC050768]|uniref:TetR/AcrR family transcriptional regulator n=1 Tax=Amycolatopsis sp. NPDC050768 TaxID=3154839 RepID=UPI0033D19586
MGRTSDAREKILASAQALLESRGYAGMGVADVCKAAGVVKGSFYYFFESKEALALAVVEQQWTGQLAVWSEILVTKDGPLDRLHRLFEATGNTLQAGQRSCGTVSGCLFGNLTLELSNQTEAIRLRLQEIFEAQVDLVHKVVAEAQQHGDAHVADTREAARSIVAQLEGQIMFVKLYNDLRRLDAMWANCLALLGARGELAA